MAPALEQQARTAGLKTPLGEDKLAITRFDGSKGLSELFTFNIEAFSEAEDVDFDGGPRREVHRDGDQQREDPALQRHPR